MAELRRELGLFSASLLVVGGIIGSGIFFTPAETARALPTSRLGARRLGARRSRRARRRADVRRARRDDARSGRRLRVRARGVRPAPRVSARLDDAADDCERRDRRGRDGIRGLSRALRADRRGRRTDRRRGDHDHRADHHELSRREAGNGHGERFHALENRGARRADRDRPRAESRRAAASSRAPVAPPLANGVAAAFVAVLFTIGGWQQTNMVAGEIRDPGARCRRRSPWESAS